MGRIYNKTVSPLWEWTARPDAVPVEVRARFPPRMTPSLQQAVLISSCACTAAAHTFTPTTSSRAPLPARPPTHAQFVAFLPSTSSIKITLGSGVQVRVA